MVKHNNSPWMIIVILVILLVFLGGYSMMDSSRGNYQAFFGFGSLLGIIAIIAAIWVIYDVLVNSKGLSDGMKVMWVIFAVLFSIITAVIYYLVGRNHRNDLFRRK